MKKNLIRREDALEYHAKGRPGKIEVVPTKPTHSQRDLSMAYSPGVAEPCLEIAAHPEDVRKYTAKGNLVGVISNGTAVLGLGNIGPEAAKPVMEGKGILFKVFADIDVFDIEVGATDVDHFVSVVKALEPTFGGINLEDIKAPECFEIERRLKEEMNIPVMHDDQHGTAIIVGAAMLNALQIVKKKIDKIQIVVSGAGASAISCMKILVELGAKRENFVVTDSHGVIRTDRKDLDPTKQEFATSKDIHSLEQAMEGADAFIGLSKGNVVSPEMLLGMAKNPIVFALANPNPEIDYDLAISTRSDIIMATGRSDHPNQVNNVLGFPYLFRGALDVHATAINEQMKLAAVRALAELAKKPVPDMVANAYDQPKMAFGRDYIIPKPIDPRLITTVSPAVAKAAMESGVAKKNITNWEAYEDELRNRIGLDNKLTRIIINRAKQSPKRVVFAEANNLKILKAAQIAKDEGIAIPILLGNVERITQMIEDNGLDLKDALIIDPVKEQDKQQEFAKILYEKRQRKGFTYSEAVSSMRHRNYFGCAMVQTGEADALISGLTRRYPTTIKPALQLIGVAPGFDRVAGMYIMMTKRGPLFFADTTVNLNPGVDELVTITELAARAVKQFDIEPRIAMLSYSNFGSTEAHNPRVVAKAVQILKERHPEMIIDGEIQANFALNNELLKENFPFSTLVDKPANTLIFPNLDAGNMAYKLLQELGSAEAIGPVLLGLKKSVHILQLGSSVREIVNMVALAVMDAQIKEAQL
jgi:malate dehydrogenase (oxaloacetate-decarboxylating)(NADP+)